MRAMAAQGSSKQASASGASASYSHDSNKYRMLFGERSELREVKGTSDVVERSERLL